MEYIDKGKCIFCLRTTEQTTFKEKPHTMPQSLGSQNIGVDICDECNHYFGEPDLLSSPTLSVEGAVKEIFGVVKVLLNSEREKNQQQIKKMLKSRFFEYWHSKNKIVIKKAFQYNHQFINTFTNQFKRGIYEMFLQEFHKETGRGLESQFDEIRNYARYNKGNIPLYYVLNNGVLLVEDNITNPKFHFSEKQYESIDTYGFYAFILWGQWFYLAVTPRAKLSRDVYLSNEARKVVGTGFVNRGIIELQKITEVDFTLRELYGK